VALYLVKEHTHLAIAQDAKDCAMLDVLAQKYSDFPKIHTKQFHQMCPHYISLMVFLDSRLVVLLIMVWVFLEKLVHVQALELLKSICSEITKIPNKSDILKFLGASILRNGAKFGVIELVTECIQTYPDQIWLLNTGREIFRTVVEHRKGKIFSIMFGMHPEKRLMACWRVEYGSNILHLAAKLPRPDVLNVVAGPALQMQREIQWFK
ncbi:hypothetical protein MKW94_021022, partial [Papaver nudicaule]|nr:hypothetical protein [Papaver nudicaule]